MPTKYRSESQKPWKTNTTVHSPYMPELVCYKTEFWDGTESYSEAFDPDDPTLVDHYPTYNMETYLGDREVRFKRTARKKQTEH